VSNRRRVGELIVSAHPLTIVVVVVGQDGSRLLKAGQEANPCAF